MEFSVRHLGNWTGDYDFGMIDDKTDKLIDKVIEDVQKKTGCQIDAQCGEKQYIYFMVSYNRQQEIFKQNEPHNVYRELTNEEQRLMAKLEVLAKKEGVKLVFNVKADSGKEEYHRILNEAKKLGIYSEPKVSLKYKENKGNLKTISNER